MRVAFDVSGALAAPTGVGRYTLELASALERRGVVVERYGVSWRAPRSPAGVRRWKLPAAVVYEVWRATGRPSPRRLYREAAVVHGTNFVLPPLDQLPGVVTLHDLWFLRDPHTPLGFLKRIVPWTVARADAVVVPTQVVADDVAETLRVDRSKIHVTHLGVAEVFFGAEPLTDAELAAMGIVRPFVLAVGTLQPRKNLRRLLEAWRDAQRDLSQWSLVLSGKEGWGPDLPEVPRTVLAGYVADSLLPRLMASADVFCFPSLDEGFGLPPLEAMAASTVAVVGDYPAAREVLGDAALIVPPTDSEAIADGIVRAATDESLRARLRSDGLATARRFTWDATAAATLQVYERALTSAGASSRGGSSGLPA